MSWYLTRTKIKSHKEEFDSCPNMTQRVLEGDLAGVVAAVETGEDVNQTGARGASPLHWAAFKKRPDIINFLIASGANINPRDERGRTPLFYAVRRYDELAHMVGLRRDDSLSCLIGHGADIYARDNDGVSAIEHAREMYHLGNKNALAAMEARHEQLELERCAGTSVEIEKIERSL
jgi:hypothetical protein